MNLAQDIARFWEITREVESRYPRPEPLRYNYDPSRVVETIAMDQEVPLNAQPRFPIYID